MTSTSKIFIAALLLAAGYGAAKFCGEPAVRNVALPSAAGLLPKQQSPTANPLQNNPLDLVDVRLVPDFVVPQPEKKNPNTLSSELAPPLSTNTINPLVETSVDPPLASPAAPTPTSNNPISPRARLRNEVPRALAFDDMSPSRSTTASDIFSATTTVGDRPVYPVTPHSAFSEPANRPVVANLDQSDSPTPAIVASYNEPSTNQLPITPIGPPPWPEPADIGEPRTHVIVDGDSLARLAGRYLHDPGRSHEIFEVNRGVLSNPELLPIGVELVIPNRETASQVGRQSPQSYVPRSVAIHATAAPAMVPVNPVPTSTTIVPRAQLAQPLPAQ